MYLHYISAGNWYSSISFFKIENASSDINMDDLVIPVTVINGENSTIVSLPKYLLPWFPVLKNMLEDTGAAMVTNITERAFSALINLSELMFEHESEHLLNVLTEELHDIGSIMIQPSFYGEKTPHNYDLFTIPSEIQATLSGGQLRAFEYIEMLTCKYTPEARITIMKNIAKIIQQTYIEYCEEQARPEDQKRRRFINLSDNSTANEPNIDTFAMRMNEHIKRRFQQDKRFLLPYSGDITGKLEWKDYIVSTAEPLPSDILHNEVIFAAEYLDNFFVHYYAIQLRIWIIDVIVLVKFWDVEQRRLGLDKTVQPSWEQIEPEVAKCRARFGYPNDMTTEEKIAAHNQYLWNKNINLRCITLI